MLRFFLQLFGSGDLPPEGRAFVDAEGSRIVLESLAGSITYRSYRAPGRYSWRRRQWFLGSLAATGKRIVAYRYGRRLVNIPYDDDRLQAVEFSVPRPDLLCIVLDVSLFHADQSGEIEIRFNTSRAEELRSIVQSSCRVVSSAWHLRSSNWNL